MAGEVKLTKAMREFPWLIIAEEALRKYAQYLRDAETATPTSTLGKLKPEAVEEAADLMLVEFAKFRDQARGGEAFLAVMSVIFSKPEWKTAELVALVQMGAPSVSRKEIYNAIGYLVRKGHLKSVAYGRYSVQSITPAGRAALKSGGG